MPSNRRSVVVDIVSDSKKFLSGFEDAISKIEKATERADILGGFKDDINSLKESIKELEVKMSDIKPSVDFSEVEKLQRNIDSLNEKIADLKDKVQINVEYSNLEKTNKLVEQAKNELENLRKQSQLLKDLGINFESTGITKTSTEINKLEDKLQKMKNHLHDLNQTNLFDNFSTQDLLDELHKFKKEYEDIVQLDSNPSNNVKLGKLAQKIKVLQNKLGQEIIPSEELNIVLEEAVEIVNKNITFYEKKIKSLSSQIETTVSSFEVKNGKISVKIDLGTSANELKNLIFETLNQVQEAVQTNPVLVPIRFVSSYKTKVTQELDQINDLINGMRKSKTKTALTEQVENLRKQILERDFKLEFKTNLPDLLEKTINPNISEIQKVLRDAKLYIYPAITIDEESQKHIQSQLIELSKKLKINFNINNFNLDSLLSDKEIKNYNEKLKKIKFQLSPDIALTDKDVERINKNLVKQLNKLHIEIDTSKLQNDLKNVLGTALIDSWKNKFISAIDEISRKINNSLNNTVKNQFYETMKGWSEADKIMRKYRKGSENSHGTNTTLEKNANGELERKAYINSKTGRVSNSYIVDQFGSISGEIKQQLKSLYTDVKNIGEIFDTSLHSHPVNSKSQLITGLALKDSKVKNQLQDSLSEYIISQLVKQNTNMGNDNYISTVLKGCIKESIENLFKSGKTIRLQDFSQVLNESLSKILNTTLSYYNVDPSKIKISDKQLGQHLIKATKGRESEFLRETIHATGSDLTFSAGDLKSYLYEHIHDGINKLMIESNGKINELDLSSVDDKIVEAIVKRYENSLSNVLQENKQQYVTLNNDGTNTVDYSKRAEISNNFLSKIISEEIAKYNIANKTKYSTDATNYLKQYDIDVLKSLDYEKEQEEIKSLVNLLGQMSRTLTEINSKDLNIDIKGIQDLIAQIQKLLSAFHLLNEQFEPGKTFSFDILVQPFERIIDIVQELSNMLKRTFNMFSTNDISNQWDKIRTSFEALNNDGSFDARKKEFQEFLKEYQKYVKMGGQVSLSNLSEDPKIKEKLDKSYLKYIEKQNALTKKSSEALMQEENKFASLKISAESAAEAKKIFSEANYEVYNSAHRSSEEITKEADSMSKMTDNNSFDWKKHIGDSTISQDVINSDWDDAIAENAQIAVNAYEDLIKKLKDYFSLKDKEGKQSLTNKEAIELNELQEEINKAKNGLEKYSSSATEAQNAQNKFLDSLKNTGKISVNNYIDKIQKKYKTLSSETVKNNKTKDYEILLENINTEIEELKKKLPLDFTNPSDLNYLQQQKNIISELFEQATKKEYNAAFSNRIDKLKLNIDQWIKRNTAASKDLIDQLNLIKTKLDTISSNTEVDELENQFIKLKQQMISTGKTGLSFFDQWKNRIKSLGVYLSTFVSFYDIINIFRRGFEVIRNYDDALTEMQKVSDASLKTLKEYQKESFKLANSVGTTAEQIQQSTADFLRLGETLDEAKRSAQDANILYNVSEFESINEATDALIAMSQAYQELDKAEINDVLNNIGNNFSISTDGLATGLQKSAAALKTAGNDLYEASALITAGNAIIQDADQVGAGIRTIALRIQGTEAAKEELASLGEDVDDFVVQTQSKIDEQVREYTAVASNNFQGVSLLDENGNYRSTYEYLQDIADIYAEIVETDKKAGTNRAQGLLELLAGKNRSNIAASILQNPELLRDVYEAAQNSEGSAQEELQAHLDSISGHLEKLKNQWQSLWIADGSREFINFFIDLGTEILKIIENLGLFNISITSAIAGFTIFFNKDKSKQRFCPSWG